MIDRVAVTRIVLLKFHTFRSFCINVAFIMTETKVWLGLYAHRPCTRGPNLPLCQ